MTHITASNTWGEAPAMCAEASELRLAPGEWPRHLSTDLGNGLDFVLQQLSEDGGFYRQEAGIYTLTVYND